MNILNEIYRIFEENDNNKIVNKSWKKCRAKLGIIPEESIDDITDLIHLYAGDCEKSGFINGFHYGIQLMSECMTKDDTSIH